jgi:predicted N-acetyltransferase YhbS
VTIDLLRLDDLGAALALSVAEGWNQSEADWRRMIQLEPSGCFVARDRGRLVGTVTTTTYGQTLAWIGMMIVRSDCRRQGIGAALMRKALEHLGGLGIASVKLERLPGAARYTSR